MKQELQQHEQVAVSAVERQHMLQQQLDDATARVAEAEAQVRALAAAAPWDMS
jgi:hypothetical protein